MFCFGFVGFFFILFSYFFYLFHFHIYLFWFINPHPISEAQLANLPEWDIYMLKYAFNILELCKIVIIIIFSQ